MEWLAISLCLRLPLGYCVEHGSVMSVKPFVILYMNVELCLWRGDCGGLLDQIVTAVFTQIAILTSITNLSSPPWSAFTSAVFRVAVSIIFTQTAQHALGAKSIFGTGCAEMKNRCYYYKDIFLKLLKKFIYFYNIICMCLVKSALCYDSVFKRFRYNVISDFGFQNIAIEKSFDC